MGNLVLKNVQVSVQSPQNWRQRQPTYAQPKTSLCATNNFMINHHTYWFRKSRPGDGLFKSGKKIKGRTTMFFFFTPRYKDLFPDLKEWASIRKTRSVTGWLGLQFPLCLWNIYSKSSRYSSPSLTCLQTSLQKMFNYKMALLSIKCRPLTREMNNILKLDS